MTTTAYTEDELRNWRGEHWSILGPSWKGFKDIHYLIILLVTYQLSTDGQLTIVLISGDSYSQTNSAMLPHGAPTEQLPLGLPFPGNTSTEGPANWVDIQPSSYGLLIDPVLTGGVEPR
jgi:hypothetical protein